MNSLQGGEFRDFAPLPASDDGSKPAPPRFDPKAFEYSHPSAIAPREWLYGHHLCRKYVSATIAPGGVGKTTLTVTDALAMVSGRNLIGLKPYRTLRVWMWNGEDPAEELVRRAIAAMTFHDIPSSEVHDRLFLDSGRETPISIGRSSPTGPEIARPTIDALIDAILRKKIDVLIVDPFVSVHSMPENDNGASCFKAGEVDEPLHEVLVAGDDL